MSPPRVLVCTPEELRQLVRDAVRAELGGAAGAVDVVDKHSAAALGLKSRQFVELARRGAFPSYRAGRRVVAKRADVLSWLERQRAKPSKSDAPEAEPLDPIRAGIEAGRLRVLSGGGRRG